MRWLKMGGIDAEFPAMVVAIRRSKSIGPVEEPHGPSSAPGLSMLSILLPAVLRGYQTPER
jgi:hypothetical protein